MSLTTSVSFEFVGEASLTASLSIEEDPERVPSDFKSKFLRVYPSHRQVKVEALTGSLRRSGSYADDKRVTVFSFVGEVEKSLPNAENVRLTVLSAKSEDLENGGFGSGGVNFDYDPLRQKIRASKRCFALVRATYSVAYDLYSYTFEGSCPDDSGLEGTPFLPGFVIAYNVETGDKASWHGSSPVCPREDITSSKKRDMKLATLRLEVDPRYPPRLVRKAGGMEASCRVRVNPVCSPSLRSTSGVFSFIESPYIMPVSEILVFSGSSSQTLAYEPMNGAIVSQIGDFVALSGAWTSASFKYGGIVSEVEWINKSSYKNPTNRVLEPNEVVAVTGMNHPVPVYGFCRVDYSAAFDVYEFDFQYNSERKEFIPAYLTATSGLKHGVINLSPPSLRTRGR